MRRDMLLIGAVILALAAASALVAVSGVVPVKASAGHWRVTERLLLFSMRRSIWTHSLFIETPELGDPALVLKGAGHFETSCRACHGSPGSTQSRIARGMLPRPPELPSRIVGRRPRELFYVIKHGVKLTGMPAWPSQRRDDEVWAMVAFLRRLPELDEAAYRRLVHGEEAPAAPKRTVASTQEIPTAVTQTCARCHGGDGLGRGSSAFPKLAGQRRDYLQNALEAYAGGARHSGIMEPIAAGLSTAAIRGLAAYYSSLPAPAASPRGRDPAIERGRAIAGGAAPGRRVPSCLECHGPGGKPAYPSLSGQPAGYLRLQLELFKDGRRGGSSYAHLMEPVVARLTPGQIEDAALFFESLGR